MYCCTWQLLLFIWLKHVETSWTGWNQLRVHLIIPPLQAGKSDLSACPASSACLSILGIDGTHHAPGNGKPANRPSHLLPCCARRLSAGGLQRVLLTYRWKTPNSNQSWKNRSRANTWGYQFVWMSHDETWCFPQKGIVENGSTKSWRWHGYGPFRLKKRLQPTNALPPVNAAVTIYNHPQPHLITMEGLQCWSTGPVKSVSMYCDVKRHQLQRKAIGWIFDTWRFLTNSSCWDVQNMAQAPPP